MKPVSEWRNKYLRRAATCALLAFAPVLLIGRYIIEDLVRDLRDVCNEARSVW